MCEIQPWNIKCKQCQVVTVARWDDVVNACDNLLAHRKAECLKEGKKWTTNRRMSKIWDDKYNFQTCGQWHPTQDKIPSLADHRWKAWCDGCIPQVLEEQRVKKNEQSQKSWAKRKQAEAEVPRIIGEKFVAYDPVARTFSTSELQAQMPATYQEIPPPPSSPRPSTLQLSQIQQPAYQSFQLPPLRDIWRIQSSQDDTFASSEPPPLRETVQAPSDRPAPRAPRVRHPLALPLPQGRFINPDEQGWRHPRALLGRDGIWINPGEEGYEDPGPRRRTHYGGN